MIPTSKNTRMEELKHIDERDCQGKFKSQRSVNDDVTVKFKIPWPQNQVLSGSTRSRPSYDQLNVFQWVSGFARVAQDESHIETIKYSSLRKKEYEKKEKLLLKDIETLEAMEDFCAMGSDLLEDKKQQLEILRKEKVKGQITRARLQWLSEGEKQQISFVS